ncbi:MAG: HEAT repeat domain-containing protein [Polyangiaceae bacterium]|nr:HEAT repeat domain-containing protein [Polyangiaceae bacterium]
MRRAAAAALVAALVGLVAAPEPARAQFDPSGRRKPTRRGTAPVEPRPRAGTKPPKEKDPAELIARYRRIALEQPGADFPLERLAALHRTRDGGLHKLLAEFSALAETEGSERWSALVALAGIYRQDAQLDRAVELYERAQRQRPESPIPLLALGRLYERRGDPATARRRYTEALAWVREPAERETLLRTLLGLALDAGDLDAARRHHRELIERAKGSFYVRAELARELGARGKWGEAVEEHRALVRAAEGDQRVVGPALRDLGRALTRAGRHDEAGATLRRALAISGGESGVRREVLELLVEVHRAQSRLPELIAELEKAGGADTERDRLLARLYEETGRVEDALRAYRRVIARSGRDVDARLKVVQLLQLRGEIEAAIVELEALVTRIPDQADLTFQLAEALLQRGERARALQHLARLEARAAGDEDVLAALVDFYERLEEKERALAILQKLAGRAARDPRHLVELGERQWRDGQQDLAKKTWQRLRTLVRDRARAAHAHGEVLVEHEEWAEGLAALREARQLAPQRSRYARSLAVALERAAADARGPQRTAMLDEAMGAWEAILSSASADSPAAREARQRLVGVWSLTGTLERRLPQLERRSRGTPPDLEAGRLLSEAQLRLRRFAEAERTLAALVAAAPGDVDALTRLERALVQQKKLVEAIEVLKKLAAADARRAREYWQRMAEHAAARYDDARAIEYATRAVELAPDDAAGHQKLAEMYRKQQDLPRAIAAYRLAIAKNDRAFAVYLELAELLAAQGAIDEADQLLRRVVRSAPDEDLVARAARSSMQLNLGRGALELLERDLLPLALANPTRPLHRRLLVETYALLALPWIVQAQSSDAAVRSAARERLARLGERAQKPLLDALGDDRASQQRTAVDLLGHLRRRDAGPALVAFALSGAELDLRVRALRAAGALRDPALLPRLLQVLAPDGAWRSDDADPVLVEAALAVARVGTREAWSHIDRLLESEAPALRAAGAIGAGLSGYRAAAKRLAALVGSAQGDPTERAAAAWALGELGERGHGAAVLELAHAADSLERGTALIAAARLEAPGVTRALAEGLVSGDPAVTEAAWAGACVRAAPGASADPARAGTDEPAGSTAELLLHARPSGFSPDTEAEAFAAIAPELARAAAAAVESGPERARTVAAALSARGGRPAFGLATARLDQGSPAARARAEAAAEAVATQLVAAFVALASHPSPELRVLALGVVGRRTEPEARALVVASLADRDSRVRRAAIALARELELREAAPQLAALLADPEFGARVAAADALAALGAADRDIEDRLRRAALSDAYALVREAAVRAVAAVGGAHARSTLEEVRRVDAEPRVRAAAAAALTGLGAARP